jgi:hypothetical protein
MKLDSINRYSNMLIKINLDKIQNKDLIKQYCMLLSLIFTYALTLMVYDHVSPI